MDKFKFLYTPCACGGCNDIWCPHPSKLRNGVVFEKEGEIVFEGEIPRAGGTPYDLKIEYGVFVAPDGDIMRGVVIHSWHGGINSGSPYTEYLELPAWIAAYIDRLAAGLPAPRRKWSVLGNKHAWPVNLDQPTACDRCGANLSDDDNWFACLRKGQAVGICEDCASVLDLYAHIELTPPENREE